MLHHRLVSERYDGAAPGGYDAVMQEKLVPLGADFISAGMPCATRRLPDACRRRPATSLRDQVHLTERARSIRSLPLSTAAGRPALQPRSALRTVSIHLQRQHVAAGPDHHAPGIAGGISIWLLRAGPPAIFSAYWYSAADRSSEAGIAAPAGRDPDRLLVDQTSSLLPILPNISLDWPGFGTTSALAAAAGYFWARLIWSRPCCGRVSASPVRRAS